MYRKEFLCGAKENLGLKRMLSHEHHKIRVWWHQYTVVIIQDPRKACGCAVLPQPFLTVTSVFPRVKSVWHNAVDHVE